MILNKIKINLGVLGIAVFPFLALNFVAARRSVTSDYDVSASIAEFSSDLYSKVIQDSPGSVAISPLMVQIILITNYLSATGKTRRRVADKLHLPSANREEVASTFQQIVETLQSNPSLKFATKLFINKKYKTTLPDFKRLAGKLDLDTELIDFKSDIGKKFNKWVKLHTNNKIHEVSDMNESRRYPMRYFSALHFKGEWAQRFDVSQTKPEPFWESGTVLRNVDMMHIKIHARHSNIRRLDATAIELPFTAGNVMVIILPNKRNGLAFLERRLRGVNLNDVPGKMTYKYIDLSLPKFNIGLSINMTIALEKLGMSSIFNRYDFTDALSRTSMRASGLTQATFLEVNEDGAEATETTYSSAAINQINIPRHMNSPLQVKVDHPFFYMVKNSAMQTIMFVGRHKC